MTLVAADSTASTTARSSLGFWAEEDDQAVRRLFAGTRGARLLAIHNPPEREERSLTALDRLQGFVDGYAGEDFDRLESLADDMELDAVVSGHYHSGPDEWSWTLGKATSVHVVGRTGGLHGEVPRLGLLSVGSRRGIEWTVDSFPD
jgi:hypothetical protein